MPWYNRLLDAINVAVPFLVLTQATNLALLVSAILGKRTLRLSELARAYPTSKERQVPAPKHELLHRLKRLWRFTDNERADSLAVQVAFVPHILARLRHPRLLGLAVDWTFFDTTLASRKRMRYQVLRIAIPRKGRAPPLLQLAYDRDALPANKSQNQLEQDALLAAVVRALPESVRPVVLVDRGFRRAGFISWLQRHDVEYVVRLSKGSYITEADGKQWKLKARKGSSAESCAGFEGCVTASTTGVPETFSSTWPCARGYRRAGRGTPVASFPGSRGIWPRA